ncbi:ECF transporter S component [Lachnospiraceae bacterium ZAX-1]
MSKKTYQMVLTALFAAIIIIMAFVPFLGYINLVLIKATLIHIPVIIGAILLGPKKGALLGFVFGCTSLINNTFNPSLLSFAFSPFYSLGEIGGSFFSVIICFVPRILVGVVPYFVYHGLSKQKTADGVARRSDGAAVAGTTTSRGSKIMGWVALPIAGILGAATNTLLVMNLIYIGFRDQFAAVREISINTVYSVILGIIFTNGIPEAIVAAVLVTAICKALMKVERSYAANQTVEKKQKATF